MHVTSKLHTLLYSKNKKNQVFFSPLDLFKDFFIVLCYDIAWDSSYNCLGCATNNVQAY